MNRSPHFFLNKIKNNNESQCCQSHAEVGSAWITANLGSIEASAKLVEVRYVLLI